MLTWQPGQQELAKRDPENILGENAHLCTHTFHSEKMKLAEPETISYLMGWAPSGELKIVKLLPSDAYRLWGFGAQCFELVGVGNIHVT